MEFSELMTIALSEHFQPLNQRDERVSWSLDSTRFRKPALRSCETAFLKLMWFKTRCRLARRLSKRLIAISKERAFRRSFRSKCGWWIRPAWKRKNEVADLD